jgi:hypothetical protein
MSSAKILSFFLHPIFTFSLIPFILVAKFSQDYSHALKWTIFSYLFILVVALFVLIGEILGVFSNFNVSKKEQRPLLFSFSAFAIFCYLVALLILHGPRILLLAVFAVIFSLIILVIVNKWIKASVHLITATAAFLLVGIAYKGYFFLPLILIPLLVWSRVKMKEHTLTETIVGIVFGVVITLIVYLVSKEFLLKMMVYN